MILQYGMDPRGGRNTKNIQLRNIIIVMKVMIAIIVDMAITVNAMMIAFPRENEIVAVIKNIDIITRVEIIQVMTIVTATHLV